MPVARQIPDSKRRSRKGCLTCRRRRRKCDEGKPACQNCSSRNVACTYDWTFVSQGPPLSTTSNGPLRSETDQFSTSSGTTSPPTSLPGPITVHARHAPVEGFSLSQILSSPSTQPPTSTDLLVIPVGQNLSNAEPTTSWTSTHTGDVPVFEVRTPLGWIDGSPPQQGSTSTQSGLLGFRYRVAPWIDSNDCKSNFGPDMMTLARGNKIISDCIAYFMWLRDGNFGTSGVMSDDSSARQTLLEQLNQEECLTAETGRVLLAISEIFRKPPSEWASISTPSGHSRDEDALRNLRFDPNPEPLGTLWRLILKIDTAASLITNKSPSTKLLLPLEGSVLMNPALQSYDECLCCLANSLRLIHHQLIPLLSGFHDPHTQSTGAHASIWGQWSDLWMSCSIWFQTRPRGMEPVFESSDGSNLRQEDFPVDVFTSTTALQANLVMHMSAVVLLANRPRLGDVPGSSHHLKSRSWHVQKIARMLAGNHFPEQWDPIVIAALLFVAKEMSHVSQQEVLLSCLQEAAHATGIPLGRDIASLRVCWQSIYQEGPPDLSHPGRCLEGRVDGHNILSR